jgi:hypothetical protein
MLSEEHLQLLRGRGIAEREARPKRSSCARAAVGAVELDGFWVAITRNGSGSDR